MARESALVESGGYMRWTRVEETMEFAWRMGYRKLGIAFCNPIGALYGSNGYYEKALYEAHREG